MENIRKVIASSRQATDHELHYANLYLIAFKSEKFLMIFTGAIIFLLGLGALITPFFEYRGIYSAIITTLISILVMSAGLMIFNSFRKRNFSLGSEAHTIEDKLTTLNSSMHIGGKFVSANKDVMAKGYLHIVWPPKGQRIKYDMLHGKDSRRNSSIDALFIRRSTSLSLFGPESAFSESKVSAVIVKAEKVLDIDASMHRYGKKHIINHVIFYFIFNIGLYPILIASALYYIFFYSHGNGGWWDLFRVALLPSILFVSFLFLAKYGYIFLRKLFDKNYARTPIRKRLKG